LKASGYLISTRGPSAQAVEDIIRRLIEVAVADVSIAVRLPLLQTFTADFDIYLSRQHHIDALNFLLDDENFDVKLEVLSIMGRLATRHRSVL
jgi:hypothetical protein